MPSPAQAWPCLDSMVLPAPAEACPGPWAVPARVGPLDVTQRGGARAASGAPEAEVHLQAVRRPWPSGCLAGAASKGCAVQSWPLLCGVASHVHVKALMDRLKVVPHMCCQRLPSCVARAWAWQQGRCSAGAVVQSQTACCDGPLLAAMAVMPWSN